MNKRSKRAAWITAAAVVLAAAVGVSITVATSSSSTPAAETATSAVGPRADGGSPARSGPAEGGAVGTVSGISGTTFTLTTPAGSTVTVNETDTTTYLNGTTSTTASAVTDGTSVLALGVTDGSTITASQINLQPPVGDGSAQGQVVPFQQGAPAEQQQVGDIPETYSEGAGTVVSGSTADQVTTAALAAYPGGVVNRVAQLTSGEYNVHNIGVNWPHHIFVDQDFEVIGAS